MIHLDTSFLVDLLRQSPRGTHGSAMRLLDQIADQELEASVHVVCELYAGAEHSTQPARERRRVEQLCSGFTIVYPDQRFAREYGRLLATLERGGERIGAMDLLIATAAVLAQAPLVTRNAREFSRVPDLQVISY